MEEKPNTDNGMDRRKFIRNTALTEIGRAHV